MRLETLKVLEIVSKKMSLRLYEQYLSKRDTIPFNGRFMPYDWGSLPNSLHMEWMPYREMFKEFSREIANVLNDLTNHSHRLKVWNAVIAPMSNTEKLDAAHEFISPLASLALTLPYTIRSRFIFAAAHLCHQANRKRERKRWKDDLPLDTDIFFEHADKYGSKWKNYGRLKRCIERINDRNFQRATHDFRNAFMHRFSPGIVVGLTQIVTRRVNKHTKKVVYAFGGLPPLSLDLVADRLADQCSRGYVAFEAFQALIKEHETCILEQSIQ